jgi:coenzyme F420-0:L-glutamate ligase/coenzyme F420-1:gamma-L-glutamate ligase
MDGEVAPLAAKLSCAPVLTFHAVEGLPRIVPGDDLAQLLCDALTRSGFAPQDHDIVVVTSKVVSKAENRYVDLSRVEPSPRALELASETSKDARAVEVVLWDTEVVSRTAREVLIVRHHGGHVSANAGLDQSNASPPKSPAETAPSGPWVLRLPADADASAHALREHLQRHFNVVLGVLISDSFGRPFRLGTVGAAIGVAGLPALYDQRGRRDIDGRPLEHTVTATADQLCASADLLCGQAAEGRAAVIVRGVRFEPDDAANARSLCRTRDGDLYL